MATISLRYGEITRALNLTFRNSESRTANTLRVGSIGRGSAIKGISDLDMLYIMPAGSWRTYSDGGQYALLRDTAEAIRARYRRTDVRVDRLVVQVLYQGSQFEVQPVFEGTGDDLIYPDSHNGGSWKVTKPRPELRAMRDSNEMKNDNLRRLCKMTRAWKNKHGIAMGGLLIDSLAHRFLHQTNDFDERSYLYYDWMMRDFFLFLSNLPKQQYFAALGSGQRVKVKKNFQRKAREAHDLCVDAIARQESGRNYQETWRKLFGRGFPAARTVMREAAAFDAGYQARNTEEFIEDLFPIDIRYPIKIDCEVKQNGFRTFLLRNMLASSLPLLTKKTLRFFVEKHDIPGDFELKWKVLNRGPEAIRRDSIRGQILPDAGRHERTETTLFRGEHIVECYAIQHGVVVAKNRIHVPIRET